MTSASQQWGLPPDFSPVRYAISDAAKNALRPLLNGEPVVISLANESDTVAMVATPERLFAVKTGELGSGAGGVALREFPWEGVENLVMTPVTHNLRIAVHYRTSNGKTVEVGRRARLAKAAVEYLMPFEKAAGEAVFEALRALWEWKKGALTEQESS